MMLGGGSLGGVGRIGSARRRGSFTPDGMPVFTVQPAILGAAIAGTNLTLDVGFAPTATSFEIEVRDTLGVVVLARQAVGGTTSGTLADTTGRTLRLNVWATNSAGTTQATSPDFGPINPAAAFTEFKGFVFGGSQPQSPAPGSSRTWTVITTADAYAASPGYGFIGPVGLTGTSAASDPRLSGRVSSNTANLGLRIDVGATGTFRVWMGGGRGAAAGVTPNWIVYDGTVASNVSRITVNVGSNLTANQVRDVKGVDRTLAQWQGFDPNDVAAGDYEDIQVTSGFITLARASVSSAIHLNCIAIARLP